MSEEQKARGIWIPNEILLNRDLSAYERVILAEIAFLDRENGCFATNAQIAETCGFDERTVIRSIQRLTDLGYLSSAGKIGRRRVLKINGLPPVENPMENPVENAKTDYQSGDYQSVLGVTTSQSKGDYQSVLTLSTCQGIKKKKNIYNNIYIKERGVPPALPTLEDVENYRKEKRERGENVPDTLTAEKFHSYYEREGWKTGKGKPIGQNGEWKKTFDQWAESEYANQASASPANTVTGKPGGMESSIDDAFFADAFARGEKIMNEVIDANRRKNQILDQPDGGKEQ